MVGEKNSYKIEDLKKDLIPIARRMPAYVRLISALLKDPRFSKKQKAALAAGLGYLVSPIDLIPGAVPLLGQLDDILAVLIALNIAISAAPLEVVEPHLEASGLSFKIIEEDAATVRRTIKDISVTTAKAAGRGLSKLGKVFLRAAQKSFSNKD